jgi:hypothetical protein
VAWGAKSVGGSGISIAAEGSADSLCQPVLARTGLEVRSDRCQWAHSASFTTAIAWISASWWYILSTTSVVGEGMVLRVLVVVASVWPS